MTAMRLPKKIFFECPLCEEIEPPDDMYFEVNRLEFVCYQCIINIQSLINPDFPDHQGLDLTDAMSKFESLETWIKNMGCDCGLRVGDSEDEITLTFLSVYMFALFARITVNQMKCFTRDIETSLYAGIA